MSGIFISYRNEGGFPTANHLVDKLERDGYKVDFDKSSLRESGRFDKVIRSQIKACTDFIVVLDKNAFERTSIGNPKETDWLRRELAYALEQKKNIIPIILPGFDWPEQLPDDIKNVRNHNGPKYSRDYFDRFYDELLSFLKSSSSETSGSKSSDLDTPGPKKSKIWMIVSGLLALALVGGVIFFYYYTHRPKEPVLLFAGGGSVRGYILSSVDSTALDDGVYMPMASTTAWPLVAEELSVGSYEDYDEQNPRPYYLILLTAEKVDADSMMKKETQTEFKRRIGYLIEVKIGESPLQLAYQNIPELDSLYKRDKMVSTSELKKILCKPEYNIFATTKGTSATWRRYNTILESKLDSLPDIKFFERKDDPTSFTNNYIILESSTYFAENIHKPRINVCDSLKNPLFCPMFIYFIAYKTKGNNYYIVPEKVRSFLTKLGIDNFPEKEDLWFDSAGIIRIYNKDERRFEK